MTLGYHVLPSADRDLNSQAEYLLLEANLETALRFLDAAAVTFENLAQMPGLGEPRVSSNPRLFGLRVWRVAGFPNQLIFKRPIDAGIEVVRVLPGARDIDKLLESEHFD